jgi:hypothetical protein
LFGYLAYISAWANTASVRSVDSNPVLGTKETSSAAMAGGFLWLHSGVLFT